MLGTYAALLFVIVPSAVVGQALFALCGRREWSWLAPAVGLGPLLAVAWGASRLPGEGTSAAVAVAVATVAAAAFLRGRVTGIGAAARLGLPAVAAALVAASLPFWVEGRFGILGTGLNPDMSQHLFAADRLAAGEAERLAGAGYPLGPHGLAVAATEATGSSLVHAFGGLTLAVAVAAVMAPLALLAGLGAGRRALGALLVGLPYMVAAYLVQGAFKETLEALFVLAFAIGLHELGRGTLLGDGGERRPFGLVPLAALAVGAAYSYSFPGLLWIAGAAGLWALVARPAGVLRPAALALTALALALAPEASRMADFARFETFDPGGAGLGNLFNRISPLEALGIWPSGDFRLDPGAGAVPAALFYLGGALALVVLARGLTWSLGRREAALPAALAVAAALALYALVAGTPYQEAKAIAIAAPLAMLCAARPLLVVLGPSGEASGPARRPALALPGVAFLVAAAGSSLLALANGPVGPSSWTPALSELRRDLGPGSTLVLAPPSMLADEHGRDFLVWELRGNRVCVEPAGAAGARRLPAGIAQVLARRSKAPPFAGLEPERRAGPYELWRAVPAPGGHGPCPLIAVGGRADPGGERTGPVARGARMA